MYKRWIERIKNVLEVQKNLQMQTVRIEFTRYELIELKVMIQTLIDLNDMDDSIKSENYCATCPIRTIKDKKALKYVSRNIIMYDYDYFMQHLDREYAFYKRIKEEQHGTKTNVQT